MERSSQMVFRPFCLDPDNACVWRGTQRLSLTPKAFLVLQYLVMHHGQLVTKDTLLEAVWPDAVVGDAVLKVCVREIRRTLGDTVKMPRFIATIYRQGYRFIRRVGTVDLPPARHAAHHPLQLGSSRSPCHPQDASYNPILLVGREEAFTYLHGRLEQARQGQRQLIFVTGEAGIGKTTLVEAFVAQIATDPRVKFIRAQCIEQYGTSEAYLPLLEAFGRLCRAPGGHGLMTLLQRQAPSWLLQMPWLLDARARDVLQRGLLSFTRERMLREIAEVLEALTTEAPLVLVLEDLHWSDYATLDLVSFLARRHGSSQLLIIGSYRPVEVIVNDHPLKKVKQELEIQRRCDELPLELLAEHEVAAYLEARFQGSQLSASLAQLIYQRTDGNPLFVVNMVEYLLAQRLLGLHNGHWTLLTEIDTVEMGIPESLKQMIEQQLERLTHDELHVLEAASVLGVEFSAAAVAAGLEQDLVQIEERCDALARQHSFLRAAGIAEWPDGTVAARYEFLHWLYQHVLYHRIGVTQRVHLHQQIGRRLELAYGESMQMLREHTAPVDYACRVKKLKM
jgi:predicted ATPase/DNA-binding winged helix-turn-helix (wHTH) protein